MVDIYLHMDCFLKDKNNLLNYTTYIVTQVDL